MGRWLGKSTSDHRSGALSGCGHAVALQPLSLLSVQRRAPGAEAEGPHQPDSWELMLFSPGAHCGNAVTRKEAGKHLPNPTIILLFVSVLWELNFKGWNDALCEWPSPPSSAPADGVPLKSGACILSFAVALVGLCLQWPLSVSSVIRGHVLALLPLVPLLTSPGAPTCILQP